MTASKTWDYVWYLENIMKNQLLSQWPQSLNVDIIAVDSQFIPPD